MLDESLKLTRKYSFYGVTSIQTYIYFVGSGVDRRLYKVAVSLFPFLSFGQEAANHEL